MVATWVHEAPYRSSAAQALEALQQQVLRDGTYQQPWSADPKAHAAELLAAFEAMELLDELLVEMAGRGRADTFDRLRAGEPPRDRVEAVLWSGAGGTRSVLDVEEAEPLGRDEVVRLFGAVHPDVTVVRERQELLHVEARATVGGEARYFVAYDEGFPAALVFYGASGH